MSKSRRSSNASAPCRFDWAPSRWLTAALLALALLAPLSLLASDLPADVTATALCAMVEGFSRYWPQPLTDDINRTLTSLWVGALGLDAAA